MDRAAEAPVFFRIGSKKLSRSVWDLDAASCCISAIVGKVLIKVVFFHKVELM